MIQELKKLCYHSDLSKFSVSKRVFIVKLFSIVLAIINGDEIDEIEKQLISLMAMIREKYYE